MTWTAVVSAVVAAPVLAVAAIAQQAQPDPLKRTTVQTIDFPPGYQTLMVLAELPPGKCTGRHTHPGAESAYVLEGQAVVKVDGRQEQMVKAGDPILFAPGDVHNVCNVSGRPFKALAHYIVEKGKPLASPAV